MAADSNSVINSSHPRKVYDLPSHRVFSGLLVPDVNSCGVSNMVQKAAGCSHYGHSTTVHVGTACLAFQYCNTQDPGPSRTVIVGPSCSRPRNTCMGHRESQLNPSYVFLCPVSKVHGVFSNRVCLSNSGTPLTRKDISVTVYGASGASLAKYRSNPLLVLGFFLI